MNNFWTFPSTNYGDCDNSCIFETIYNYRCVSEFGMGILSCNSFYRGRETIVFAISKYGIN